MSLASAMLYTHLLCLLLLFIQSMELFILSSETRFMRIWTYANIFQSLEEGLPLPTSLIRFLFSDRIFKISLYFQNFLVLLAAFFPHYSLYVILLVLHLLTCIRFRGAFNGGSDMMTFIVLTGLLISYVGYQKEGMIYIAVHTIYSYFKAGLSKSLHKEWWNGTALPIFFGRSIYTSAQELARFLGGRNNICILLSAGTVLFELSALALIFFPDLGKAYCCLAVVFHFLIYLCFGLNRFFWAWLTAWPATLFSLTLLGGT